MNIEADSVFLPWYGTRPRPIFQGQDRMTDILHARAQALTETCMKSKTPNGFGQKFSTKMWIISVVHANQFYDQFSKTKHAPINPTRKVFIPVLRQWWEIGIDFYSLTIWRVSQSRDFRTWHFLSCAWQRCRPAVPTVENDWTILVLAPNTLTGSVVCPSG